MLQKAESFNLAVEDFKGLLVAGFMRPLGHRKCSKLICGDNKVNYQPNYNKIFSKYLRFFSNYFFENEVQT
jgi:hypothetical protein